MIERDSAHFSSKVGIFLLLLLFGVSVIGCGAYQFSQIKAEIVSNRFAGHYILSVPFVKQRRHWCGPSALASVLQYWGNGASQQEIAKDTYLSTIRGTLNFDIVNFASKAGFWTQSYRGSLADLKEKISRDIPLILLEGRGPAFFNEYHFLVIIGYDDGHELLIAHSGKKENLLIPYNSFLKRWKRSDYWTLLICPPEVVDWPLTHEDYSRLGILLEREQKLDLAIKRYLEALKIQPEASSVLFNLGNSYLKKGLYTEAIDSYRKVIRFDSGFADAYNNLAYTYIQEGASLEEIEALITKAVELNPQGKFYYLDTKGEFYLTQARYQEAILCFQEAKELVHVDRPEIASLICYHLGLAYLGKGLDEEARMSFGEALRLNPDSKIKDKIIEKTEGI